jgi:hypothetical protein
VLRGPMMSVGRTLEKLGTALYSPECVEGDSLLKKSLSDPSIGQIVSKHSGNTAKTLQ